ncbi:hypothetical protein AcV5_004048 [Taiwanofungus camphoratus]|nr:hypothetical protein AcV5_004048 [Antrodia cinnamomea]
MRCHFSPQLLAQTVATLGPCRTVAEEGQVKNQESGHKRKCRDAEFSAVAPGGLMGAYFNYCPTAYLRLSHLSLENT